MAGLSDPYPSASMDATEYEIAVADLFSQMRPKVEELTITHQERVRGTGGSWKFDFTMRYRLFGMRYLVLGEAKRWADPVKREVVELIHGRKNAVGGHKAVVVATVPFQRGAIEFAEAHGVTLIRFVDGAVTYEVRTQDGKAAKPPPWIDIPKFVAYRVQATDSGARMTMVSGEPGYLAAGLPGFEAQAGDS